MTVDDPPTMMAHGGVRASQPSFSSNSNNGNGNGNTTPSHSSASSMNGGDGYESDGSNFAPP